MPTDPLGLRSDAPLLDAWLTFQEQRGTPFTIPGHKHNRRLVGDVIAGDVPYYAGLDTMKLAHGTLAAAAERAATLWGADTAYLSVGGSTHGNQAAALAVGRPGDRVAVARTAHRSMFLALVLAGLDPVWVTPRVDDSGMPGGLDPADLATAMERAGPVRAVLVGDPSYVGTVGDVAGLAQVAHGHGCPLVVDAAWAAHFGFHPLLPSHALSLGADLMVTSAHKTLPAWSQGALVLARHGRIDPSRLAMACEATATTSPSGAILASIDAARALLERHGERLLGEAIEVVARARERLAVVDGLAVLDGPTVDPLKLTLDLRGTGADGRQVEAELLGQGRPLELADRDLIVAMVTLADDEAAVTGLVNALIRAIASGRGNPRRPVAGVWDVTPLVACSPRAAYFSPTVAVPIQSAVGRVCGELIAPYPPGIPVLAPGEVVTDDALDRLRASRDAGSRIAYAADPTLERVTVLDA